MCMDKYDPVRLGLGLGWKDETPVVYMQNKVSRRADDMVMKHYGRT